MPLIKFKNEHLTVEVPEGANLRQVALENGVEVYQNEAKVINCRGRGLCGTCRMQVSPNRAASPRTVAELKMLAFDKDRLSCQAQIVGDCTVTTYMEQPHHDRKLHNTRVVTRFK